MFNIFKHINYGMDSNSKKEKSKAAFLVELDNIPDTQIQELSEENSFMVFYPKEQHRVFRKDRKSVV